MVLHRWKESFVLPEPRFGRLPAHMQAPFLPRRGPHPALGRSTEQPPSPWVLRGVWVPITKAGCSATERGSIPGAFSLRLLAVWRDGAGAMLEGAW